MPGVKKFRSFVWHVILFALVVTRHDGAEQRPNIVFVLMDDLRWDALGLTGHPFVKTPAIDRVGREGMLFRNAFVTTPLCFPSRASILTGQYAHRHGMKLGQDLGPRSHELETFPLLLQRAGYETGFFGKWHLGAEEGAPPPGMDRWVSFREQGQFVDPMLNIDGKMRRVPGYLTDLLTDQAIDFIRQKRTKPFLVYLSHKAVHAPFTSAKRHETLFADQPIVRAASAGDDWAGKPVLKRPGVKLRPNDSDVTTTDEHIRGQLRTLVAVDEGLQRIIAALEEAKQLENTVVIFTSDNGYFWGEHQLGGKHGPYEESIRVPFLVRYPRLVKPGSATDALVLNIDIAPTLLELAGQQARPQMQGKSLFPLLNGQATKVRDAFAAEFFLGTGTPRFPTWQAWRTERWKYVRYSGFAGMDELYDLRQDPQEMRNLADDPATATRLQGMRQALDQFYAQSAKR